MSEEIEKIHTVHAYRWGDRDRHSYTVGVFRDGQRALAEAKHENQWRGGKYECEVIAWEMRNGKFVEGETLLALPATSPDWLAQSIKLNDEARQALTKYKEVLATEKTLTSDKEVTIFREELRGYAVEFLNACMEEMNP